MSADNGIYIAHFADGEIRIAHVHAIENCWYRNEAGNAESIVAIFKNVKVFSKDAADKRLQRLHVLEYAHDIASNCYILEYGISEIRFEKTFEQYEQELKCMTSALPSVDSSH